MTKRSRKKKKIKVKKDRPERGKAQHLVAVEKVRINGQEKYVVVYKRTGSKNPRGYTANVVSKTIWAKKKEEKEMID